VYEQRLRLLVLHGLPYPLSDLLGHLSVLQVQANPQNAPAWRLLGTVHAENDDDRQVRGSESVPAPAACAAGFELVAECLQVPRSGVTGKEAACCWSVLSQHPVTSGTFAVLHLTHVR
jgi:hypothetical protein